MLHSPAASASTTDTVTESLARRRRAAPLTGGNCQAAYNTARDIRSACLFSVLDFMFVTSLDFAVLTLRFVRSADPRP